VIFFRVVEHRYGKEEHQQQHNVRGHKSVDSTPFRGQQGLAVAGLFWLLPGGETHLY